MKLAIKVVPGASRECIVGWLGEALKVCVKAPAEKGKANSAVEKIIASTLGIPVENIKIIKGSASPRKIIEITGMAESEVHKKLASIC